MLAHELVSSPKEALSEVLSGNVIGASRKFSSLHEIVHPREIIRLKTHPSAYVSRGGDKLASVFVKLDLCVAGQIGIDCGASTGGFTDFLLREGAKKMISIDVGYGILAHTLRIHPDVLSLERVNVRELTTDNLALLLQTHPKNQDSPVVLPVDFIVGDVSFISLRLLLPVLATFLKPGGFCLVLFKPQFEAWQSDVPLGGVIQDLSMIISLVDQFRQYCEKTGWIFVQQLSSEVTGTQGNQEIFVLLRWGVPVA